MRLHYLQHVPNEGLGSIAAWADQRGAVVSVTRLYAGDPFPAMADFDGLVILGGPMNIYEESTHRWLIEEKAFIRQAIAHPKHILALCLGSQLVADALGARIKRNEHDEIGWFPVKFSAQALANFPDLPRDLTVFHWHSDTFDLPNGAMPLASSEACSNQGYVSGDHIVALQFHPEVTPSSLCEMIGEEVIAAGCYTQASESILAQTRYFDAAHQFLHGLLDRHFGSL